MVGSVIHVAVILLVLTEMQLWSWSAYVRSSVVTGVVVAEDGRLAALAFLCRQQYVSSAEEKKNRDGCHKVLHLPKDLD